MNQFTRQQLQYLNENITFITDDPNKGVCIKGKVGVVEGDVTCIQGEVGSIVGNVRFIWGNVNSVFGDVSGNIKGYVKGKIFNWQRYGDENEQI